jgi:colanic acid/amylovoran biosynthesis glycosyltransferase
LILRGAPLDKISVIRYNISDFYEQTKNQVQQRYNGSSSIVFLGRLVEKKNPLALLEAFRIVKDKIPDARLTIIGEGPLHEELEKRILNYGLNHCVKVLGSLKQEEALKVVARHWVYAQHSNTSKMGDQEGFALSIAEAALMEMPIVSTIHNGITEQVIDGITGYLVQEFDFEAMAERIIRLLSNPDSCKSMGKSGRIRIKNLCNLRARVDEILQVLRSSL